MLLLLLWTSAAHAELSREFTAVSNFMWRGTTFSKNKPALQTEWIYETDSSTEFGTFFSNAEFEDPGAGQHTTVRQELDLFIVQNFKLGEVEFSPTLSYFSFFDAWFYNSSVYSLTTRWRRLFAEVGYMDRYFGYQSTYTWFVVGYTQPLPQDETLTVALGTNQFSKAKGGIWERDGEQTTSGAGNPAYQDLMVSWKKPITEELTAGLAYIWTDREEFTAENGEVTRDDANDETVVVELAWNI